MERASSTHAVFAFAAAAFAFCFSVVGRAKPTGKTANADCYMAGFHCSFHTVDSIMLSSYVFTSVSTAVFLSGFEQQFVCLFFNRGYVK